MILTERYKSKLRDYGISETEIESQFNNISNGAESLQLQGPCTPGNGILILKQEDLEKYCTVFDSQKKGCNITMFTPASGAATRMFKHLLNPDSNPRLNKEFKVNLGRFAFYDEIDSEICTVKEKVDFILGKNGLNYAHLPKAMISFHKYNQEIVKAIDDQIIEGLNYLTVDGRVKFHYTISPEHEEVIRQHLKSFIQKVNAERDVSVEVEYSFQENHTDTIALNPDGTIVEDENGDILLRPGGHGSLIHNLNGIDSDFVFIKNIDNIARREWHSELVKYKKLLGGYLMAFQNEIFEILNELDSNPIKERLNNISIHLKDQWGIVTEDNVTSIRQVLNRPIRVAAMVKNEGKAGGGPFWVNDSLQIVESAQMDVKDPKVVEMLQTATHFNPVDIVCALKDYKGNAFNLNNYVDKETFFVSEKSYLGKDIKVLEHPGLWNGAMAKWLTLFIEVPVVTFNPVKTVNDLLDPKHSTL